MALLDPDSFHPVELRLSAAMLPSESRGVMADVAADRSGTAGRIEARTDQPLEQQSGGPLAV